MKNKQVTDQNSVQRFSLAIGFAFGLVFSTILFASAALAQSPRSMFDCERQYRECEMRAERQPPGDDPCSAYSRCQAAKMCEASRCVCLRTQGSEDPALTTEAQAVCFAVLRPHAGNSCDRYIDDCLAWSQAQHQKPEPDPPAHPPGTPQPLRPDQLPR